MNRTTIGQLAAEMLVTKCNWRCRRLARDCRITDAGTNEGEWGLLEKQIQKLRDSNDQVEKLAGQRLAAMVEECLKPIIEETKELAWGLRDGRVRFEQYSEGLITASEYMNGLIDEVNRR